MTADAHTPGGLPPALPGSGGLDERALSTWIERAALFALVLTVLKGLRMPSRWAMTHYLITYKIGFVKRGLWGEVLWRVLGRATADYFLLAGVAFAVFAAFLLLVLRELRRLPPSADRAPFLLCFCSFPALSFLTHVIGYAEHLAYLAVVVVIAARRWWPLQAGAALTAAAALPFVHEASVLWAGPPMALALLFPAAERPGSARLRLRVVALVATVFAAATWIAAERGALSREYVDVLREDRTRFASFRPRQDAFEALREGYEVPVATMRARWQDLEMRRRLVFSAAVLAPGWCFFVGLLVRRACLLQAGSALRSATVGLVALTAVGPLTLHLLGWDLERWNADAAMGVALAALAMMASTTANGRTTRDGAARSLGLALMITLWGISADLVLFDRYAPSYVPFRDRVYFLEQVIRTRDPELWLPMQGN
jgi:hypothetical protein